MTLQDYQITIRPLSEDEGGGFFAEVPDLPGCHTDGETPQEALANLYDAFDEWIDSMERMGAPIPQPRRLAA
ncbi:MAG TPA: type II toxin-antitoxin system HicB family antitoxin [Sphingomonadaceae bacterium]|jgi:predicted RNase H-like HicB family nuclease|nr:type II toxin-antitoxin system HicB family antitoxin [Sphingomonadaceae bacterium]